MTSPSSSTTTFCFQCEDSSNSVTFRNGWRLRSGKFAQLCHRCASVYEYGRFCVTFHSSDDGWRDCESCGKVSGKVDPLWMYCVFQFISAVGFWWNYVHGVLKEELHSCTESLLVP
ncbi:hypothetical protein AABB24_036671 [Solanum stoloniferum]|uniref:Uncharacterized protein n=1 Tax=Solanum stoloniferum TaxID=62892 RepID=A0ABD2R1T2_9SOLN